MPESTDPKSPATGDGGQPETGKKEPAPATGTATPATGESSDDSTTEGAAAATAPTPEEWAEAQASIKRMEEALKKANKESENRRKAQAEAERAGMSEADAAKAKLEELEKQAEAWQIEKAEFRIEREVTRLTPKLGLVDPEGVTRLLDWDSIRFEENGLPAEGEVERVVRDLVAAKPYLVSKQGPAPAKPTGNNATDGTSGSGPAPNLTAAELEQAKATGMTPERYAAMKSVKTLKDYAAATRQAGPAGGKN